MADVLIVERCCHSHLHTDGNTPSENNEKECLDVPTASFARQATAGTEAACLTQRKKVQCLPWGFIRAPMKNTPSVMREIFNQGFGTARKQTPTSTGRTPKATLTYLQRHVTDNTVFHTLKEF